MEVQATIFPQEIIEIFIDCLWHSAPDLRACALVGRAWLPRSQRQLFWTVCVDNVQHYLRFKATIDSSPHLSNYIRCLSLNFKADPARYTSCSPALERLFDVEKGRFRKLRHLNLSALSLRTQPPVLPRLLNALPSLEQLSLDLIMVSSFGQLLFIPSNEGSRLRSLELGTVGLEDAFASLTRLNTPAGQAMFAEVEHLLNTSPSRRFSLDTLRLTGNVSQPLLQLLLFHPKACFPLDRVGRMLFEFNPLILRFVREMPLMVSLASPSHLAFLSFNCDKDVSMSLESSLRHLVYNECVPPGLSILILNHIIPAHLQHLERLTFFITSSNVKDPIPIPEINPELIAKLLEAIPALKRIYLVLVVQGYSAWTEKVTQSALREYAASLLPKEKAKSGLLTVDVFDREVLHENRVIVSQL